MITYDSDKRRAYDDETGVAISFKRMGIPQEAEVYLSFERGRQVIDILFNYDSGGDKIDFESKQKGINLTGEEWRQKTEALHEFNLSVSLDFLDWKIIPSHNQEKLVNSIVALVKIVVTHRWSTKNNFSIRAFGNRIPKSLWREEKWSRVS